MPYGDLVKQAVQRFAKLEDLDAANCTIEEREEYEPHIDRGVVVFAGVDYEKILRRAEEEVDVILWDGGNNDLPFIFSDMHIVLVDPHRPGHELRYYPGESNLLLADVILINKIDTASLADITQVRENVQGANPDATILEAASPILVENPELIKGKKVLVVEDGPTLTHGEMAYGAGWVAAKRYGAREIIDPRPFAVGSISQVYEKYLTVGNVLPAMGYGEGQIRELEQTINRSDAEVVIIGTPIDLGRLMDLRSPTLRIRYELQIIGKPTLEELIEAKFGRKEAAGA
jgi:predicted GTPase